MYYRRDAKGSENKIESEYLPTVHSGYSNINYRDTVTSL